jgi:hypothetical protein
MRSQFQPSGEADVSEHDSDQDLEEALTELEAMGHIEVLIVEGEPHYRVTDAGLAAAAHLLGIQAAAIVRVRAREQSPGSRETPPAATPDREGLWR